MSAVMIDATDRDALHAQTKLFERAERCIETWAFERRRQQQQTRQFFSEVRRIRSASKVETPSAAVFHGKPKLTKRERIEEWNRKTAELEQQQQARAEIERARRGAGPVHKCKECQRIYRGDADTCGCRPCAHCGARFRGNGFKCESCKTDPDLITARGSETRSFVPRLEAQPGITPLSADATRIESLLNELPPWMAYAIEQRYLLKESDHKAAENLMIPVPTFAGRARAAVARVAELLANNKNAHV